MTNNSSPGVFREVSTGGGGGCNTLPLPPTVSEALAGAPLKRVNMILVEYARDVALLQSRAYDAVLKVISEPGEE